MGAAGTHDGLETAARGAWHGATGSRRCGGAKPQTSLDGGREKIRNAAVGSGLAATVAAGDTMIRGIGHAVSRVELGSRLETFKVVDEIDVAIEGIDRSYPLTLHV